MPEQQEVNNSPIFIDPFLQNIVQEANEKGSTDQLTLSVSGFLISGELVGKDAYIDDVMKLRFGQRYEEGKRMMEEIKSEQEQQSNTQEQQLPQFIHLRNARVFHPGQPPIPPMNAKGLPWRIRLTAVDGFMYGILAPSDAQ